MPSPFPGMDPYIEQPNLWADFHNSLANEVRTQLNAQIRPNYFARMEAYVTYEVITVGKREREKNRPDVSVWRSAREAAMAYQTNMPVAVETEIEMELRLELMRVQIYSTGKEELVTVIEILSPVNKQVGHEAHTDYLAKRRKYLNSRVHFIEIDFLCAGERPPLARPVPDAPYYVMVSRASRRPYVDVWCIQLADHLPVIPVPLSAQDADAELDLGVIVASVYERGAYDAQIDYREPVPTPRLAETEQAWVDELLKMKRQEVNT